LPRIYPFWGITEVLNVKDDLPIEKHSYDRGVTAASFGGWSAAGRRDGIRYLAVRFIIPSRRAMEISGSTVDKGTFGGIIIAAAGIGAGLVLDGGKITQVLQPTAALIVLGGTIGAVMVQYPLSTVLQAIVHLKDVFLSKEPESDQIIQNLLRYALKARKEGILSLDGELNKIQDPFLKESLMLAIDGVNAADLRKMMELQLEYRGEKDERLPKVYESAAGFAPTIGIIGAVLGLIQVMQRLQDINEVGKGIAVAFVATIYGVASANLFFLPCAGKLRIRIREREVIQEMTLEAVLAIINGVNPRALEMQLRRFINAAPKPGLQKVASR
jgi:chemotaxis protein MotA